jgi:hypothetical protein
VTRFSLVLCLAGIGAHAQVWSEVPTVQGMGRITVSGGVRHTPNEYYFNRASEQGRPVQERPSVGPAANASFGYGVLDFLEIAIDGYFAYERFSLSGWAPFSSFTYGGFLGARLTKMDFPFRNFVPYVQVMSGATLSIVSSPDVPGTEKLQPGFAAGAGFTYRILERFGVSFDFKWLMARHFIADLAGMNVGGLWFTVGLTLFFPSEAKREPDLPRF